MEHLLGPRLSCFSWISSPFQPRLILIFMSWSWRANYYSHYRYNAFWGRKITLGLAEARAITAPVIRLVWFMIYADHIWREITPLEVLGCKKKNCFSHLINQIGRVWVLHWYMCLDGKQKVVFIMCLYRHVGICVWFKCVTLFCKVRAVIGILKKTGSENERYCNNMKEELKKSCFFFSKVMHDLEFNFF